LRAFASQSRASAHAPPLLLPSRACASPIIPKPSRLRPCALAPQPRLSICIARPSSAPRAYASVPTMPSPTRPRLPLASPLLARPARPSRPSLAACAYRPTPAACLPTAPPRAPACTRVHPYAGQRSSRITARCAPLACSTLGHPRPSFGLDDHFRIIPLLFKMFLVPKDEKVQHIHITIFFFNGEFTLILSPQFNASCPLATLTPYLLTFVDFSFSFWSILSSMKFKLDPLSTRTSNNMSFTSAVNLIILGPRLLHFTMCNQDSSCGFSSSRPSSISNTKISLPLHFASTSRGPKREPHPKWGFSLDGSQPSFSAITHDLPPTPPEYVARPPPQKSSEVGTEQRKREDEGEKRRKYVEPASNALVVFGDTVKKPKYTIISRLKNKTDPRPIMKNFLQNSCPFDVDFWRISTIDPDTMVYNIWMDTGVLKRPRKVGDGKLKPPFDFNVTVVTDKSWFYTIHEPGKFLDSSHMDVLFYYLRKSGLYGTTTQLRFTTTDVLFDQHIKALYTSFLGKPPGQVACSVEDMIIDYIFWPQDYMWSFVV
ncbi:Unknown protein, partial [Striga hermonthica]